MQKVLEEITRSKKKCTYLGSQVLDETVHVSQEFWVRYEEGVGLCHVPNGLVCFILSIFVSDSDLFAMVTYR
jgi:hypothetical protein